MLRGLAAVSIASLTIISCGTRVDTGRNADPNSWPQHPNHDQQNGAPDALRTQCFQTTSGSLPVELKKVCDDELRGIEELKGLVPILCDSGYLISALEQPQCGWDGKSAATKKRYVHKYYMQKDTSQDYEDITSSIVHVPVTMNHVINIVRLAYENFEEYTRRGYQWTSGTRENRNISGTKWEDGLNYRFRADKDVYEVGYQGHIKYIQLTPKLGIHINRATGDFERIKKFSQIVLYSQLEDNTALTIRLENRQIQSNGLYDLAKKSALDLDYESMEKGFTNAVKN